LAVFLFVLFAAVRRTRMALSDQSLRRNIFGRYGSNSGQGRI
jgi:hypothetical protein